MKEVTPRTKRALRMYWLVAAIVAVPIFVSSAIDAYWVGMIIGVLLFARGVYGYRAGAAELLSTAEASPETPQDESSGSLVDHERGRTL